MGTKEAISTHGMKATTMASGPASCSNKRAATATATAANDTTPIHQKITRLMPPVCQTRSDMMETP